MHCVCTFVLVMSLNLELIVGSTGWSTWMPFSECYSNCTKTKRRECGKPPCKGSSYENWACTRKECAKDKTAADRRDVTKYMPWGSWSLCSLSCGDNGTHIRSRSCKLKSCPGELNMTKKCVFIYCANAPIVLKLPSVTRNEGDSFKWNCTTIPPGYKDRIRWKKGKTPLLHTNSSLKGSLFIRELKLVMAGEFTCYLPETYDSKEATATLTVHYKPKLKVMNVSELVEKSFKLRCIVDALPAVETVEWYKGTSEDTVVDEDILSRDGIVTFVMKQDLVGVYTCRASNILGTTFAEAEVAIGAPPKIKLEASEFVEGQEAKITCDVTGYPPPTIKWYKDDDALDTTEATINISKVSVLYEGEYECRASNKMGNDTTSVTVTMSYKPKLTAKNVNVIEGQNAVITCDAKAIPTPSSRKWYFNNQFLNESDDGKMTIWAADKILHEGNYTCTASNDIGNSSTSMTLTVLPTTWKTVPQDVNTELESSVKMECSLRKWKNVQMSWFWNERKLYNQLDSTSILYNVEVDGKIFKKYGRYDLNINSVTAGNSGQYMCATPSENVSATLIVKSFPEYTQITPITKGDSIEESQFIELNCTSTGGNPPPVYIWHKQGKQIVNSSESIIKPTSYPKRRDGISYSILKTRVNYKDDQATIKCGIYDNEGEMKQVQSQYNIEVRPKSPEESNSTETSKNNVYAIAGGSVGGVLVFGTFLYYRVLKKRKKGGEELNDSIADDSKCEEEQPKIEEDQAIKKDKKKHKKRTKRKKTKNKQCDNSLVDENSIDDRTKSLSEQEQSKSCS